MKKHSMPLFTNPSQELSLTSDFRKCGTCGAYRNKEGGCCKVIFPNSTCWHPKGSIPVEDEDVDNGVTSMRIEG